LSLSDVRNVRNVRKLQDFEYSSGIHKPVANTRINLFILSSDNHHFTIVPYYHLPLGCALPLTGSTLSYPRSLSLGGSSLIRLLDDYILMKLVNNIVFKHPVALL
jgi:hypothetical protein